MTRPSLFRRLPFLPCLGGMILALLLAGPAFAAGITVQDAQGLAQALKSARGGERIVLADNDYGSLELSMRPQTPVTLVALTPGQARFAHIKLDKSANLAFDGIDAGEEFRALKTTGLDLRNMKTRMFYFRDVDDLRLEASEAADGWYNLLLNSVTNFTVRNNRLHGATEDVMRITGRSFNGLLEGNQLYETVTKRPLHPDLLQFFPQKDQTPHDIVIRRNLFWDDPTTGDVPPQAVFLGDTGTTGFRNILIEENLIAVGHTNTIYINGGQHNVVVRNNILMSVRGATMPDAIIRIAQKSGLDNSGTVVHGNVVRAIRDETKASRILGNYIYGNADRLPWLVAGPGGGRRWQDFVPVAGSPIDFGSGFGPEAFLKDLLAAQKPPLP